MLRLIKLIPLLSIQLIAYNLFMKSKNDAFIWFLNTIVSRIKLPNGQLVELTAKDWFIISGILFLFIEICKSTGVTNISIMEHIFSIFILFIYVFQFFSYEYTATSAFLILMILATLDVLCGLVVSITAARKDISMH